MLYPQQLPYTTHALQICVCSDINRRAAGREVLLTSATSIAAIIGFESVTGIRFAESADGEVTDLIGAAVPPEGP